MKDYNTATSPVNHAGLPTTCDTCHKFSDTSWTQATFNHSSVFPLVGVHATTACAVCHNPPYAPSANNYTSVPTSPCSACHLKDYNTATSPVSHTGMPTTCDSCHGNADSTWMVASAFNHAAFFPLSGAHSTIATCAMCHN